MAKHFNAGNVWGSIIEYHRLVSTGGKPFLWMKIDVSGEHGSLYVFGRMWGKDRVETLLAHIRKNPSETIRFRGFIEQYTREVTHWNYTFYAWEPAPGSPRKAAFVLRGKITDAKIIDDGAGKAALHLVRGGKEGYPDIEEHIEVFCGDPDSVMDMGLNETWEFKGYIRQGAGEDEFGVTSGGLIRPYAKYAKRIEEGRGHDGK